MRILELRVSHRLSAHVAAAELSARDGGPPAEVRVMHRQVHVRESCAAVQRRITAAVVSAITNSAVAPAVGAIPRMEAVTRSERKPADRAPTESESNPESVSRAKSEERNISRRPNRTIVRISIGWTRPPSPPSAHIHPPTIVVRSPAPGIIRNPGPSPIRLINPAPGAIRSPARRFIWPPHWTVVRNLGPSAIRIEIFGSDVIIVRLPPRYRVADHVVAIGVPLIPVIASRRFANLVLRLIANALNSNELALSHSRATLRSSNFDFASANQHFGVIVGSHKNSKARFAPLGANGNVGCIDFGIRIAVLVDGVVRHSVPKLNLNLRARELRNIGLRMLSQAQHVGIVELKFGARFVAGGNAVTREDGGVEHSRGPVFGIAALRGNVTMNQTDARHASGLSRSRRTGSRVAGTGAGVHRALIRRARIHGPLVVGTLHLDARRRLRILIRHLVVRILGDNSAGDRDHQS